MTLIVTDKTLHNFTGPAGWLTAKIPATAISFSRQDGHDMRLHHSLQLREGFVM